MSRINNPITVVLDNITHSNSLTYTNPLEARRSVAASVREHITIEIIKKLCEEIDELEAELKERSERSE